MAGYEKRLNSIFRAPDKEFVVHPSSSNVELSTFSDKTQLNIERSLTPPPFANPRELSSGKRRGSLQPVKYRYKDENHVEAVRRREIRRAVLSSPSYGISLETGMSLANDERFAAITDSSDYRESGLKKLKSNSWESIARWEKENEFLFTLIEDECDWLKRLFPDESITAKEFFIDIEDGYLLCKLAQLCQRYAEDFAKQNKTHVPLFPIYIHSRNKCRGLLGKFRRRENVELFLKWCRVQKIPEPLLFESNDVVERTEEEGLRENAREIVLCLMEVARLGVKYGIAPPQLILLEKEIELEEQMDSSVDGSISPMSVDSGFDTMDLFHYGSTDAQKNASAGTTNENSDEDLDDDNDGTDNIDSYCRDKNLRNRESNGNNGDHLLNSDNGDKKENDIELSKNNNKALKSPSRKKSSSNRNKKSDARNRRKSSDFLKTELHNKVTSITESYDILKITRLKEGKYIILGKVMFVRLLNSHCLVRIGGGWDTLEHYVITHVNKVAPDSFEADIPAKDSFAKKTSRKANSAFAKNKFLAKSTPNLLNIDDSEEVPISLNDNSSNESVPPRPASVTPVSRDPYFVEKQLRQRDDRKISQAILRIHANVAGLKRASSLDWTHLKGQELNVPSFSVFDSITQESFENIKAMADVAINNDNTILSDTPSQLNGSEDNGTLDQAVSIPDVIVNDENAPKEIGEQSMGNTETKPDDIVKQTVDEQKEKPKAKKVPSKAGSSATTTTSKKPATGTRKASPSTKTVKTTTTKTNKITANGTTTNRVPLSSRSTTSARPTSSAKPSTMKTATRVKSTTSTTSRTNSSGTTIVNKTTMVKTKTSSTVPSATRTTSTTTKRVPSAVGTTTSRAKPIKSTTTSTADKSTTRPASSTSRTSAATKPTSSRPVDSVAKKPIRTAKTTTVPPMPKTTKASIGAASRSTATTGKSSTVKTTSSTVKTTSSTVKTTSSKPISSTTRTTKSTPASSTVATKKLKTTTATSKTAGAPTTTKSTTTKKTTTTTAPKITGTASKSKRLSANKSADKNQLEKKASKELDKNKQNEEKVVENSSVVLPTAQVMDFKPEKIENDEMAATEGTNIPEPVLETESGVLENQTTEKMCNEPIVNQDEVSKEEENVTSEITDDKTTNGDILLVLNDVKIPKDENNEMNNENSSSNVNTEISNDTTDERNVVSDTPVIDDIVCDAPALDDIVCEISAYDNAPPSDDVVSGSPTLGNNVSNILTEENAEDVPISDVNAIVDVSSTSIPATNCLIDDVADSKEFVADIPVSIDTVVSEDSAIARSIGDIASDDIVSGDLATEEVEKDISPANEAIEDFSSTNEVIPTDVPATDVSPAEDVVVDASSTDDVVSTDVPVTDYLVNDVAVSKEINTDIPATNETVVTEESSSFTLIPHDEVNECDSENEEKVNLNAETVGSPVDNAQLETIESSTISIHKEDIADNDVSTGNEVVGSVQVDSPPNHSNMVVDLDADLYCVTPLVSGNFEDGDSTEIPMSDVSPFDSPSQAPLLKPQCVTVAVDFGDEQKEIPEKTEPIDNTEQEDQAADDLVLANNIPSEYGNLQSQSDEESPVVRDVDVLEEKQQQDSTNTSDIISPSMDTTVLNQEEPFDLQANDDPDENVTLSIDGNCEGRDELASPDGLVYMENRIATPLSSEEPDLQSPRHFSGDFTVSNRTDVETPDEIKNEDFQCSDVETDVDVDTGSYQSSSEVTEEEINRPTEQFTLEHATPLDDGENEEPNIDVDTDNYQSSSEVTEEEEVNLPTEQFTLEHATPLDNGENEEPNIDVDTDNYQSSSEVTKEEEVNLPTEQLALENASPLDDGENEEPNIDVDTDNYQSSSEVTEEEEVNLSTEQFMLENASPLDDHEIEESNVHVGPDNYQSSSEVKKEEVDLPTEQFILEHSTHGYDNEDPESIHSQTWSKTVEENTEDVRDEGNVHAKSETLTDLPPQEENNQYNDDSNQQASLFTNCDVNREDSTDFTAKQYYGQTSVDAEGIAVDVDTKHQHELVSDSEESASSQSPNHHVIYSEKTVMADDVEENNNFDDIVEGRIVTANGFGDSAVFVSDIEETTDIVYSEKTVITSDSEMNADISDGVEDETIIVNNAEEITEDHGQDVNVGNLDFETTKSCDINSRSETFIMHDDDNYNIDDGQTVYHGELIMGTKQLHTEPTEADGNDGKNDIECEDDDNYI